MHIHPVYLFYRGVLRAAILSASLLLIPLLGSRFADGWNWDSRDYIAAGALVFGTALTYQLTVAKVGDISYRLAVGVALITTLALVWINLAVGIIGAPDNPANLMYVGVLLIGAIGACLARLQPTGMVLALFAMATALAVVAMIVLTTRPPSSPAVPVILFAHGTFAVLFLISALFFRRAAQQLPRPCP